MKKKDKDTDFPLIGIFGWKTGENSYGCTLPYLQYFNKFGITRILSPEEDIDKNIDLIVVPGGPDILATRYGSIPNLFATKADPIREYFDTDILPGYIDNGTPIFGICRGLQSIVVLFGGRLLQNMFHETNDDKRYEKVHAISLVPNDFRRDFERYYKKSAIKVNSMHHQCMSPNHIPEDIEILGYYSGKYENTIEVIRHKTAPIYGVQYHPEELYSDDLSDFMIRDLISRSKNFIEEEEDILENVNI